MNYVPTSCSVALEYSSTIGVGREYSQEDMFEDCMEEQLTKRCISVEREYNQEDMYVDCMRE